MIARLLSVCCVVIYGYYASAWNNSFQDILHTGWINEWMCILTTSSFRGRDLPTNCLNVRCLQALICYLNMTGEDKNSSAWGFRKRTWNVWCAAKWTNKQRKKVRFRKLCHWLIFFFIAWMISYFVPWLNVTLPYMDIVHTHKILFWDSWE